VSQVAAKVVPSFASEAVHVPQIHRNTRTGYTRLPGLGSGGIAGTAARPPGKPVRPVKQQSAWTLNRVQALFFKASCTRLEAVTQGRYL
jgi:hypothetical protein